MTLPEGWKKTELGALVDINMGQSPSSSDVNSEGEGIPFFQGNGDFGFLYPIARAWTEKPLKTADQGDILFSVRAPVGEINISPVKSCIGRGLCAIRSKNADQDYIFYVLQHFKPLLQRVSQGSTFAAINRKDLLGLSFSAAPLSERGKIADILVSVDKTIKMTQDVIVQTMRTKTALMNKLLTHGFPGKHKKFKPSPLGEVPNDWEVRPLGTLFDLVERRVDMDDNEEYQLVTVKRRNGGVVERERLTGKKIKVKNQYWIEEGDFLISKRQIVHGACEIVPAALDGSIVSNEYSVLQAKDDLYLPYFRWVSRAEFMYRYFLISSVGVHIEKMLFKLDQWFKLEIPLPPLEEQKKITEALESMEHSTAANQAQLDQLQQLKTALMQVLLTGKVRVPVAEPRQPQSRKRKAVNA
jgi:type I restriction enzyme, S subunit